MAEPASCRLKASRVPSRDQRGSVSPGPLTIAVDLPVTGVDREDVAAAGVCDEPVPGGPERRRKTRAAARDECRDQREQQGQDVPGQARSCATAIAARGRADERDQPWGATFQGMTRPAAGECGRSVGGLVAVRGHRAQVEVVQEAGQFLLEASLGTHAGCPPGIVAVAW